LETVGSLIEAGIDIANYPLSGLEGLSHLIKSSVLGDPEGGLDKAVSTIRDIQQSGLGQNLGERAFESTGSPLVATAAELTPDLAGVLTGRAAVGAIPETAETIGRGLQVGAKPVIKAGKEIVEGAAGFQSPAKRGMVKQIEAGSNDPALAGYEVARTGQKPESDPDLPIADEQTGIERFFDTKGPRVKTDKRAVRAIKQGWREGVIQPLKNASVPDRALATRMTNIAERAKKDELYGMENRPGDVAGDLLMGRLDIIRKANKRAGQAIKPTVEKMRGQRVDVSGAGDTFSQKLNEMGITFSHPETGQILRNEAGDIEINFSGSDIEGLAGPENVIKRIIKRIDSVGGDGQIDAAKLHQLKKFIDEQVTFGKNAEGLAGETERALKGLRADINRTLGENFPSYAKANETYSGTIDVLDAFQDVAGRKMNLLGDNADKATGTLMRRLMSNAQSRITLLDSLNGIDDAVTKYGGYGGPLRIEGKGGAKNDLKMLVLYADELDRILGSAPRTSLQGQFDQAFGTAARAATSKSGLFEAGVNVAGKVIEKGRGINEENAIKTIKELLREKKK